RKRKRKKEGDLEKTEEEEEDMNEIELEGGRVKALSYKVKGISRESPSQKGSNVVETDLRNHWSTATNTKEWILLQLDEPCLLSHIRIYNKSVLEWEISLGLRYKPETFIKARPRCEAPRRDMVYPMNYTPCRYVRISCLRGNPIAIFFIQLIGVPVIGLEPEFQPVVNHLLPHITSHKQDAEEDIHLKLLQDLTNRLTTFLPLLEILKGVLASNIPKQEDSDFESTRESLLQVLANLTSVQSYFDFFSKKTDEKLMASSVSQDLEIQEAEIELDLTRKEQYVNESSNNDLTDWRKLHFLQSYGKEDKRLQEIKDEIESLEMAKLKEEIVARRQKKLLVRRARQKHLEEIALREAELLQELDSLKSNLHFDRERAAEMENEIERQKLLAVERAKTSELQHNLDMEKEKRTQRELQRELEQAESGIRPGSRREFSSNSTRPRERYRERDNGRPTNDLTNPSSSSMPSIVVAGSRQYAGQAPTLLQARDEGDEENFEGSRDSGDTGSLGEADLVMALEGQSGQRRGNKSRQMRER
ncbi:hypothetical protein M8C21_032464, partial [Ambrosia artemisiifolia]